MRVLTVIASGVLVSAGPSPAATPKQFPHHVTTAGIVSLSSYTGSIDESNFDKFIDVISTNTDKVIELKISVERSRKDQNRYYVSVGDSDLTISCGDPMGGSREVLINGPVGTTFDMLKVDGFYLVKNGGMHAAGALSWALVPVDEASIRLNPNIRIFKKSI